MAAAEYRPDTNAPVRNGDATVAVGGKVYRVYQRPQPDVAPANGLGGPYYDALANRFLVDPSGWSA